MSMIQQLQAMMSSDHCPDCGGKEAPAIKTLDEIRIHLASVLERLSGVEPLAPIPGHLFKTLCGRTVLVAMDADPDKDFVCLEVKTGARFTVRWNGQPYYRDLGDWIVDAMERCYVLVKDLGPVAATV